MEIVWIEWTTTTDSLTLGHGVCFHDRKREREEDLVAFVDGFEWLHGNPRQVTIRCIKTDKLTTSRTLNAFKRVIEDYVRRKEVPSGMLTRRLAAIANA
jgi:hypothetical protein